MFRLYSDRAARKAIERESVWIRQVAAKYQVPASWIQAILLKEMTALDLFDPLADLAVRLYYFRYRLTGRAPKPGTGMLSKNDSSTGWAQISACVAINALNFAADRGIADYADFGFDPAKRLRVESPEDRWLVWRRLNRDRHFNIEMCALNLLNCAEERTGKTDVLSFSPEEEKQTFTRYNGNVPQITPYAETVYRYRQEYRRQEQQKI